MNKSKKETPKGILNAAYFTDRFSFDLLYPSAHLQHYIEHYWFISYHLPKGALHQQAVIPHPCCHLTFLKNGSDVKGVQTQRYTHNLVGSGNIVGTKFTPAGFQSITQKAGMEMVKMPDNSYKIDRFFDIEFMKFENHILKLDNIEDKAQMLEAQLYDNLPKLDPNAIKINEIVRRIDTDKDILKVVDICRIFGLNERQLQRLLLKFVGVSAKWIINRYRIHEALMQVETQANVSWSELALNLGYYDQAHFIKDFKNLIGLTPLEYQKQLASLITN